MAEIGTVGLVLDILATIAEPTAPEQDSLRVIALLIGIPLLTIVVVAATILGPQWSRAGRWRPGQPWVDEPVWLGSGDPDRAAAVLTDDNSPALLSAEEAAVALTHGGQVPPAGDTTAPTRIQLGGARGQW